MKKNVSLNGRVLLPLQEGQRAVIQSGGSIIHTSLVVEIIEQNPDFELQTVRGLGYKAVLKAQN